MARNNEALLAIKDAHGDMLAQFLSIQKRLDVLAEAVCLLLRADGRRLDEETAKLKKKGD